jgi:hypothetical protein
MHIVMRQDSKESIRLYAQEVMLRLLIIPSTEAFPSVWVK